MQVSYKYQKQFNKLYNNKELGITAKTSRFNCKLGLWGVSATSEGESLTI